ncbi:MAG: sensor histidine kinase [Acidimicrobiales bacterium]
MAAMVVGALLFAGLATLGLTVLDSVHETQTELVTEAKELAQGVEQELSRSGPHNSLAVLQRAVSVLRGPLGLQGEAVFAVSHDGSFFNPLHPRQPARLPSGLTTGDIYTADFVRALPVSGHRGRLAWAALLVNYPVPVSHHESLNVVVILTREAPTGVGSAGIWFALASAATVVVALIAANRLGHRIARPLQQTEVVTGRIASGDLAARVRLRNREGRELVSLANSVNQMAAHLARAQRSQRQFLMSVSHDLRTPLTSIRGFAEALADGKATDVPHASAVILAEASRLERLVGDLLELAKLEAGAFSLQCRSVDLSEVVTEAVHASGPAAASLGLDVALLVAPPGTVLCQADPDRLGQVVCNVVENALKYATTQVTVRAGLVSGHPTLVVEDDGPGIAPEDLDKVFERLYQSSSAASRKLGSGLGLAIVEELVAAMGGAVRAESPAGPGGGARIVVSLQAVSLQVVSRPEVAPGPARPAGLAAGTAAAVAGRPPAGAADVHPAGETIGVAPADKLAPKR